jgi:hypothetical protein
MRARRTYAPPRRRMCVCVVVVVVVSRKLIEMLLYEILYEISL